MQLSTISAPERMMTLDAPYSWGYTRHEAVLRGTAPISFPTHKHLPGHCLTFSLSGRHINSSQILRRVWERRLWNFPSQRKQEATISRPTSYFSEEPPLQRQRFTFEIGRDTFISFRFIFSVSVLLCKSLHATESFWNKWMKPHKVSTFFCVCFFKLLLLYFRVQVYSSSLKINDINTWKDVFTITGQKRMGHVQSRVP